MATLAEVEVAIRANLGGLVKDSAEAKKRIQELEKQLKNSADKIAALNASMTKKQVSDEERARKRAEAAATKSANKKIAEAERAARKEAAAAERVALANERARRREIVAAEKAARAKAKAAEVAAAQQARGGLGGFMPSGGAVLGTLFAGFGAIEAAKEAKDLIDTYTKIQNALKVAGLAGDDLTKTYKELLAVSKANAAPVDSLIDLYSKASLVQNDLGASQERLMKFTENTAKALRVSGRTVVESRGALLQLGQALSSSTVRAEEFNSIQEGALPILQAVANGMSKAGGSVAKLRNLVINGEVSSKEFFDAFEKGAVLLDKQLSGSVFTIDQGFTNLRNTLIDVAGRLNEITGASGAIGEGLGRVAKIIDNVTKLIEQANQAANRNKGGFWDSFSQAASNAIETTTRSLIPELQAAADLMDFLADEKKVEGLGDALFGEDDVNDRAEEVRKEIRDVYEEMDKLFDRVKKQKANLYGLIPRKTLDDFLALRNQIKMGGMATEDARQAIIKFAEENKEVSNLPNLFNPLIDKLFELLGIYDDLTKEVKEFNDAQEKAANPGKQDSTFGGWRTQSDFRRTEKFKQDRLDNSEGGKAEKQLDKRQKEILEEAKKQGVTLTAIEARLQAIAELSAENKADFNAKVATSTAELIKEFEGFRVKAYWDKNAWRAGFGSDTTTAADGTKSTIQKGQIVDLESSLRDLERRIKEFQDVIRGQIGGNLFDSMDEGQQAALTSIAYNYGSLPDRIVKAIQTGNNETIYGAIRGLAGDNKGINSKRRMKEAEVFAGRGFASDFEKPFAAQENFDEMIQRRNQEIETLRSKQEVLGSLNPMLKEYSAQTYALEMAEDLLADAQRSGVAAGKELKSVNELLYGDLTKLTPEAQKQAQAMRDVAMAYGEAKVSGEQLKDTQKSLAENSKEFREFSKGLLSGFISDLREGKSAAEALSNALNKVAEKLMDMALDSFFGTGANEGKGGFLFGGGGGGLGGGGILGGLLSLIGFSSGTENTGGARGQPRGVVHGQEAVIPLPDGGKVPVDIAVPKGSNGMGMNSGKVDLQIELLTDETAIAGIAKTEIKNAAPGIISVSVKESSKENKKGLPGNIVVANQRTL